MDNGLEDLWRRENPDSSEFALYNRSSGTRSMIDRIYTDIKIADNTKNNHVIVSISDHYNAKSFDRLPQKLKLAKINGTLIILFYVIESFSQLQKIGLFIKNIENPFFSKLLMGQFL